MATASTITRTTIDGANQLTQFNLQSTEGEYRIQQWDTSYTLFAKSLLFVGPSSANRAVVRIENNGAATTSSNLPGSASTLSYDAVTLHFENINFKYD